MVKRLLMVSLALVVLHGLGGLAQSPSPPDESQIPEEIRDQLLQMSGGAAHAVAQALGLTALAGKPLNDPGTPLGRERAPKFEDVSIASSTAAENEPTIAANPVDQTKLVGGSHRGSVCVVYISPDGGSSWSAGSQMPLRTGASCSDPVIVYAPDGARVYYAYMDILATTSSGPSGILVMQDLDIVVSHSDDDGATWAAPVIALNGDPFTIRVNPLPQIIVDPGFVYDKPWIGTARDTADSQYVYVTATRFRQFTPGLPPNAIAFARSLNRGVNWSSPVILDSGADAAPGTPAVVVQGSRPAGGSNGEVLVAWYQSGTDGFLNGQFQIRTRRSADYGMTWDPLVVAASELYELRFFQGPFDFYRRWWPAMMPDVEITPGGAAHIAYTYSPLNLNLSANVGSSEQGDIRYITSDGAPYAVWSAPLTVNDDGPGRAQGFAAINVQHAGAVSMLHLVWEDTRLAPNLPTSTPQACFTGPIPTRNCDSPNLFYDVFYARRLPGQGTGWSENMRLSDTLSIQDFTFGGDYIDLAVNDRLVYAIWTDRRDQISPFASDDDIMGGGWGLVPGEPVFVQTFDFANVPCHGLTVAGVTYTFTVGGTPSLDCRAGTLNGPGVTNNIQAPNIEGNGAGILRLAFSSPTRRFGFGVAQSTISLPQTVTVDLFGPGTGALREELVLNATRDPLFVGGRFEYDGPAVTEVTIQFSSPTRFALDNLTYSNRGR